MTAMCSPGRSPALRFLPPNSPAGIQATPPRSRRAGRAAGGSLHGAGAQGLPPAHAATGSSREGLWRMKMTPIRAKLITLNASPARNAGA